MRHPNQATLALHAGGDLGPFQRWLTARHVARCAACREEVAGYNEMRDLLPELAELPEISWNRMAAEIKANVRLGLEAGECVREAELPLRRSSAMTGWRAAVAFASVLVLVISCMVLEHPMPKTTYTEASVRSTDDGVMAQAGQQMFGLTNGGAQKVTYTLDAQGSMKARYTDPETGTITINTISYAQ